MEIAFLVLRIMLAAALYAFLGWALYLLWRRLRQQSQSMEAAPVPGISLRLRQEDLEPDAEKVFRFSRSEVIIGRQSGSDLRLDDSTISAHHARLAYHHAQWWLEDLHSKNGTFLNQERVSSATVLTSGDALRCGGVELEIDIAEGVANLEQEGI
jgi:pSer/pThr/pTyr-binding forkhead associated (FHA) protein